ncbi:uncharacterized protein [Aristolochia californica]|uniref:uncharacterized protein n=1 Tax=Aristolochia californica TaxID=171875 RepID=UPI0035E26C15
MASVVVFFCRYNGKLKEKSGYFDSYDGGQSRMIMIAVSTKFNEFLVMLYELTGWDGDTHQVFIKAKIPFSDGVFVILHVQNDYDLTQLFVMASNNRSMVEIFLEKVLRQRAHGGEGTSNRDFIGETSYPQEQELPCTQECNIEGREVGFLNPLSIASLSECGTSSPMVVTNDESDSFSDGFSDDSDSISDDSDIGLKDLEGEGDEIFEAGVHSNRVETTDAIGYPDIYEDSRELNTTLRANFTLSPNDIRLIIKDKYHISVKYGKAWRAKCKAIKIIYGDWDESFILLPQFLDAIKEANPANEYVLCCEAFGHEMMFKRVFWAFGPSIAGFQYCRPLISVDGTHLYGKYPGTLLIATTLDGKDARKANITDFDHTLQLIEQQSERAKELLTEGQLSPEFWSLAHDGNVHFGVLTTNMSECFNNVLKGARSLPIQVDLVNMTCTCTHFQMEKIPCTHAIAVCRKNNFDFNQLCGHWYTTKAYRRTYAMRFYPPKDKLYWPNTGVRVVPPIARKQPGRPRSVRVRTEMDKGEHGTYPFLVEVVVCAHLVKPLFEDEGTLVVEFPYRFTIRVQDLISPYGNNQSKARIGWVLRIRL